MSLRVLEGRLRGDFGVCGWKYLSYQVGKFIRAESGLRNRGAGSKGVYDAKQVLVRCKEDDVVRAVLQKEDMAQKM